MGYTLAATEMAPILDGDGIALHTADLRDAAGNGAPFGVGQAATIVDDGNGDAYVVGNHPGSVEFDIGTLAAGVTVAHTVTVTGAPFDWTLGAPVPK